jgi:hypothetical protein
MTGCDLPPLCLIDLFVRKFLTRPRRRLRISLCIFLALE